MRVSNIWVAPRYEADSVKTTAPPTAQINAVWQGQASGPVRRFLEVALIGHVLAQAGQRVEGDEVVELGVEVAKRQTPDKAVGDPRTDLQFPAPISLEPALSTKLTTEAGEMKNCEVICWSVYSDLNRAVAKVSRCSANDPFRPIS